MIVCLILALRWTACQTRTSASNYVPLNSGGRGKGGGVTVCIVKVYRSYQLR